jgi:N-formylglutamate amidohydrolase
MTSTDARSGEPDLPPWVVLHVPHDSTFVPDAVRDQFVLSDAELQLELLRMTDHLTHALFAGPPCAAAVVRAPVSRLVVDVERFEDDASEPMAERGMGVVYTETSASKPLRRPLSVHEREALLRDWYRPHHARLEAAVSDALAAHGQCLVIDCHSFPSEALPYERAEPSARRPDVCIGTDGFHTHEWLAESFLAAFEGAGWRVARDTPFSGAIVPASRYRQDARVAAVMVELKRGLYLDEAAGSPLPGFDAFARRVREACVEAVDRAVQAGVLVGGAPEVPSQAVHASRDPVVIDPARFDPALHGMPFPPSMQGDVDEAVADAHAGWAESPAAARLAAALGARDEEEGPWLLPDLFEHFFVGWVLSLSGLSFKLEDDAMRERWADLIDEDAPITDAMRAEYARDLIGTDQFGSECDDALNAAIAVPLRASDGRVAVLCGGGAQQGNVGFSFEWWGVYRDADEMLRVIEARGWYRLERAGELPDGVLLEFWDR